MLSVVIRLTFAARLFAVRAALSLMALRRARSFILKADAAFSLMMYGKTRGVTTITAGLRSGRAGVGCAMGTFFFSTGADQLKETAKGFLLEFDGLAAPSDGWEVSLDSDENMLH